MDFHLVYANFCIFWFCWGRRSLKISIFKSKLEKQEVLMRQRAFSSFPWSGEAFDAMAILYNFEVSKRLRLCKYLQFVESWSLYFIELPSTFNLKACSKTCIIPDFFKTSSKSNRTPQTSLCYQVFQHDSCVFFLFKLCFLQITLQVLLVSLTF
jgi:hypothetical protein